MKRIIVITALVAGLVGAVGASPASAGSDRDDNNVHCDTTLWNIYCENDEGYWISCDFTTDNDWDCDDGYDTDAPPSRPSVAARFSR